MPARPDATTLQLDTDGRIMTWPGAAASLFGRTAADAIGRPLSALVEPRQRVACANVVAHVFQDGSAGRVHTMDLRAEAPDGSVFPVECSLWYCAGGGRSRCNVLVRDISDRVRLDEHLQEELRAMRQLTAGQMEALQQSHERFIDIVETIDEVFWIADPSISRMLYISPGYERLWGRSCQSLYDDPRSFMEAVHPDDRERVIADLTERRNGRAFAIEYRVVRPDGTARWVSDRGFPVRGTSGEIDRYIGVVQDISVRKMADDLRRRQDAADAIGRMALGLSREFSNVLGLVVGHLDLASFAARDGKAHASIAAALEAALRGVRIARRLQSLGGREPASPRLLDLGDAVDGLHALLRHAAGADEQVALRVEAAPRVDVDPASLDAALITLAMHLRQGLRDGGRLSVALSEDLPGPARASGAAAVIAFEVEGPHAALLEDLPVPALVESFASAASGAVTAGLTSSGYRVSVSLPAVSASGPEDAVPSAVRAVTPVS